MRVELFPPSFNEELQDKDVKFDNNMLRQLHTLLSTLRLIRVIESDRF